MNRSGSSEYDARRTILCVLLLLELLRMLRLLLRSACLLLYLPPKHSGLNPLTAF
ncbi:MAG: hypothetical protein WCB19_10875 [Thermoplasmata archaeon]